VGKGFRRLSPVMSVVVLAGLSWGCGDDTGDGASGGATTTVGTIAPPGAEPEAAPELPVTVTGADDVEVTVTDASRIIPANGDIAEVVFALGLGDSVVATDISATYPPEADALPEVGYQRSLLAEPMLGLEPTVVIANTDAGPPEVIDQLRRAGVAVVVIDYPHDLSGPAAKIRLVATALGVPARGEALARRVQADIDDAAERAERHGDRGGDPVRAAFLYLRGSTVQQVGGRGTGVDALLEAAGAQDLGVEMGIDEFRPLTDEALIEAAPEVLVVTTSGLESVGGVDGLTEMPAIAGTPAGRERRVVALDDQLLLGLGPRAGEALAQLVDALHPDNSDSSSDAPSGDRP